MMISEKKNKSVPVKIAPTILVATNGIANSTIENSAVPTMPLSSAFIVLAVQDAVLAPANKAFASKIAKYTTATPKVTHKNAGVTVITAMMRKKAATTPIIRLATTAMLVHAFLQPQPKGAISKITSHTTIFNSRERSERKVDSEKQICYTHAVFWTLGENK